VPEPASALLLGAGLAALGGGALTQRVRRKINAMLERWSEDAPD
jgi:hypothetical protein